MISIDAREIIEDIQRSYYLHPEDIEFREANPRSKETRRQLDNIRQIEGILDL